MKIGYFSELDQASADLQNEMYAYLDGHSLKELLGLANEAGKLHQETYGENAKDKECVKNQ